MRASIRCCCVVLLLATAASHGTAQPSPRQRPRDTADPAQLVATADRIIKRYMEERRVLAVVRQGELLVEKGYGVRSPSDPQTPDVNTLFYIGSLSKAVTGVGVELLVERGKINLNDPVSRYVKDLPRAWRQIPVKLFLAHQSGIPEIETARQPTFSEELRQFDRTPLAFQPGTKQQYNNFNFAIAGKIIEGATGRPYLEFMHDEVFQPLGMTRTGYGQNDPNSSPGHYLRKNDRLEAVREVAPKGGEYGIPSGFIQTTLADLVRLYRGLQQHKLLSPARTREMLSPVTPDMSGTIGWFAREVGGVKIVAKNGAAAGYSSQFQFAPGRGDAVIFIMNLQGKINTDALAHDLLREVCALPLPPRAD